MAITARGTRDHLEPTLHLILASNAEASLDDGAANHAKFAQFATVGPELGTVLGKGLEAGPSDISNGGEQEKIALLRCPLPAPWDLAIERIIYYLTEIMRHWIIILLSGLALTPMAIAADALYSLAGSEWGFPGAQSKMAPYIQFRSGGRISGFGGCNRFNGSYAQTKNKLRMGPLAATRMACSPQIMKQEMDLFAVLSRTRTVAATHLALILKDSTGAVLATLARRDAD